MRSEVVVLALLLAATAARASEDYARTLPGGARPAGFGGAFVAVADDPNAAWYNPAGLADLRHTTFSVSTNVYALQRVRVADGERKIGRAADTDEVDFWMAPVASGLARALNEPDAAVPQSAGFVVHQADVDLVDRRVLLDGAALGAGKLPTDRFAALQREEHRTTRAAVGYGVRLSPRWAVGASVVAWYHTVTARTLLEIAQDLPGRQTGYISQLARVDYGALSGGLRLGVLWTALPDLTVGLAVQSPGLHLYGAGATQSERARFGTAVDGGNALTAGSEEGLEARHGVPFEAALGVAWGRPGAWRVTADVTWDAPVEAYRELESDLFGADGLVREKAAVLDVAIGGEVHLLDALALRGGVFTQRSNVVALDAGQFAATDPGDRYGGALAVGVRTGRVSVDVGALYQRAAGRTVVAGPAGERATDRTEERLMAFLGAAYHLDEDEDE